jgi:hypothetical protein
MIIPEETGLFKDVVVAIVPGEELDSERASLVSILPMTCLPRHAVTYHPIA